MKWHRAPDEFVARRKLAAAHRIIAHSRVKGDTLWCPRSATERGTVTLRGSIASYTEKWAAEQDARHVRGVVSVVDNLEVRLPQANERTDADLVGTANDALRWNSFTPNWSSSARIR